MPVEQLGVGPRTTERTLRKLTAIEKLRNNGLIEPHEAAACEWYGNAYALGYEFGQGVTANYGGMSGRGSAGVAEDRVAARFARQADARTDYAWARAALPPQYIGLIEALVCHGARIGDVGRQAYESLSLSTRATKTRAAFKLCANLLHGAIGHLLDVEPPCPRPAGARTTLAPIMAQGKPVSDAVDEALAKAEREGASGLWLAPAVLEALKRENRARDMIIRAKLRSGQPLGLDAEKVWLPKSHIRWMQAAGRAIDTLHAPMWLCQEKGL